MIIKLFDEIPSLLGTNIELTNSTYSQAIAAACKLKNVNKALLVSALISSHDFYI